jgi:iron complex outermembrane receptor protein
MHRKIRIILAARSPIPFPQTTTVHPKCHLNALVAAALMLASSANAEVAPAGDASNLDAVQVTANRFAEQVQEVPNSIEVIGAEELRARGVNDLRTALSLLGGVSVAPGGDEGPAAAVPSLLGLREVDDFELLIDGVPAGGAFIPQFATLDLSNVERIEVQRGPAPVLYGTTAFAGTINLIHYAAGSAEKRINLAYGTFGSVEGSASTVLAQSEYRASLGVDGARERYSDSRSGLDRGHLLLRNAMDLDGGEARLGLDATLQHQRPASPRPLEGAVFDPETPLDFNQNPADGKIDTNRFQLTGAYDKDVSVGSWGTTLSVTHTHTQLVQGFFNPDSDAASGPDNATGFHQARNLTEAYLDTHLTHRFGDSLMATFGASELYGRAHQDSQVFSYTVPDDGSLPTPSGEGTPQDSGYLSDRRSFAGTYAQTRWNLTRRLGLLAGLRLNHTDERRSSGTLDGTQEQRASTTRLSGSFGANWRVWQDAEGDLDDVVLYASYGNTFQTPQIDFGPDNQGPLLRPETARSYESGIKADGFDGRFSAELSVFCVDFDNQPVATVVDNTPALVNGGRERYKGAELELNYRLVQRLALSANYSYNDARYRDFQTVIDGASVQLAGNQLLLSPHDLAGLGLTYGAGVGFQASLVANYVGNRYLDMQNTVNAGSYITVDTTLGYAFSGYSISVSGYNLSNRRDPVLRSELGEGQFYLLPGRRVFVRVSASL